MFSVGDIVRLKYKNKVLFEKWCYALIYKKDHLKIGFVVMPPKYLWGIDWTVKEEIGTSIGNIKALSSLTLSPNTPITQPINSQIISTPIQVQALARQLPSGWSIETKDDFSPHSERVLNLFFLKKGQGVIQFVKKASLEQMLTSDKEVFRKIALIAVNDTPFATKRPEWLDDLKGISNEHAQRPEAPFWN